MSVRLKLRRLSRHHHINHVHPTTNQIGRQCGESVILTIRRTIFDRDGEAFIDACLD